MRINLLPQEHRPSRTSPLVLAVILLLAIVCAPLGYYTYQLNASVQELTLQEQSLSKKLLDLGDIMVLVKERDELNGLLADAAAAAGTQQFQVTEYITELTRLLPSAVVLSELSLTRDTLSINGSSNDIASLVNFLGAVVASPYYGDMPNVSNLNGSSEGYVFSITVAVGLPKGEAK